MDQRERDLLLREARAWAADGTIPAASLPVIEERLASAATADERPGMGVLALHGAGGALLGAGAIALVELLGFSQDTPAAWTLLACGTLLAIAGLLAGTQARLRELAEALLVGAAVALAFAAIRVGFHFLSDPAHGSWAILALSTATLAGIAWSSTQRLLAPPVATLGALLAGMLWAQDTLQDRAGPPVWLACVAADLAAVFLVARPRGWPWSGPVLAVLPAGVAVGVGATVGESLQWRDWGVPAIAAGLASLGLLALALARSDRSLATGAAVAVAGSAIAYAFSVGGLVAGVIVLVASGVLLIGLATFLLRRPAAPPA